MTEDAAGYAQLQRQEQRLEMHTKQPTLPYQTIGELELFSLNRIRDRLARLEIDPDARWKITECLTEENRKRWSSGNHRKVSCTPYTLDHCVEKLREYLNEQVKVAIQSLPANTYGLTVIQQKLQKGVAANVYLIKNYLSEHYTLTLRNTDRVIPAPVVRGMEEKVQQWAQGKPKVFSTPLEPLVREIAEGLGLYTNGYSSRKIWDELMKVA